MKYTTQQKKKKNPLHCHTKSLSLLISSPRLSATRNRLYGTNKIQKEIDYVKKSIQCDTRDTITISSRNNKPSRCFQTKAKELIALLVKSLLSLKHRDLLRKEI